MKLFTGSTQIIKFADVHGHKVTIKDVIEALSFIFLSTQRSWDQEAL